MRVRLALAFLLAAAFVGAARADDAFDAFRQICVEAHGDETQALALADSARWMPIPQTFIDQLPKGQFLQPQGRLRTTEAAVMFLIVGHGPVPTGNLQGRICGIGVSPGDVAALEARAQEFAQLPKDASGQFYAWREENGAHVFVGPRSPGVRALLERGAVNFMVVRGSEKMAFVLLMVPSK
jgi:hypothetical protein